MANNTITDAKVISQSESSFAQAALNEVLDNAIGRTDYLSLDTDGVTGATLTSIGVIDALNMAIATSKGEKTEEEKIFADGYCDIVVIGDSKDLFFDDTMKGGHYLNDPELVRSFVANGPLTIDWLISLGADLSDIGLMGGSSAKRTHRPQGGTAIGPHLMKVLKEASESENVEIRTSNKTTFKVG